MQGLGPGTTCLRGTYSLPVDLNAVAPPPLSAILLPKQTATELLLPIYIGTYVLIYDVSTNQKLHVVGMFQNMEVISSLIRLLIPM